MEHGSGFVEVIAVLLAVVGLSLPLAQRLRLPHPVVLAILGTALGSFAVFVVDTHHFHHLHGLASSLTHLPLTGEMLLTIFLPALLFQSGMMMDARRLLEDAVPILVMAVVAVFVTTGAIGAVLDVASPQPMAACLLVGAIVATTDPSAVVAIFRDLGAPTRLTRLVEGESLLNDAAAIAIFTVLVDMLHHDGVANLQGGIIEFVRGFPGGLLLGIVSGRIVISVISLLNDDRAAVATLLLSAPYLLFIGGGTIFHVSGVVAVATFGLVIGTSARARVSPHNWEFLEEMWEQLAFWSGSLVFFLASLLMPSLLVELSVRDLLFLGLVILAATVSRGVVLFGFLPVLTALGLSAKVSNAYKLVITWGGLRGAVTVALALAIREDSVIPEEIRRFVVVLATGFALCTLLINGTTLRWVINLLKLDQLGARDQALRDQIVALSLAQVRDKIREIAADFGIGENLVRAEDGYFARRIERTTQRGATAIDILERDRLVIGLIALANHERRLVLEHHAQQAASRPLIEFLLRNADRLTDGARSGGRLGYMRASKRAVRYSAGFRIAHLLHRWTGIEGPLARRLAYRFEALRVSTMILDELGRFSNRRLAPFLGDRIVELLAEILATRQDRVRTLSSALRLQYPEYFDALDTRFIRLSSLQEEEHEYQLLYHEGLIGQDVYENLRRTVRRERARSGRHPGLDLKLRPEQLIARIELFSNMGPEQLKRLARLARPRLAVPDEVIYRRGQRGDSMFFISSGAVEVRMPTARLTLGRGEIAGQMSLLTGEPRVADVVSLTYSHLLVLYLADFRRFLGANPDIGIEIERITQAQTEMNRIAENSMPNPVEA